MPPLHNTDFETQENAEMTTPSSEHAGTPLPPIAPNPDPAHALPAPSRIPAGLWIACFVVLAIVVIGVAFRLIERASAEHALADTTHTNATPSVNVVHPVPATGGAEIALPGNTQAWEETPIYARTSGYLKKWLVDIGAHVTQGQLMATIETPELDEQLMVAKANLQAAQADLNLANTTSQRYQNLLKQDSVSKQETDVAVSGAAAKKSAVEAAEANVRRLEQLQSFERVYAPYSGIVTVRNTDVGDLIDAGSPTTSSSAKELFHIADVHTLRVFVAVPEVYAPDIQNGDTATLTLDEYPGQQFVGTIARNSNAIDQSSRTLNVEVDVNNSDSKLLPGAYAFVHFKVPQQQLRLAIPSNTLLFRAQGLQVATANNGRVHLQNVTIGKDDGKSVEIASGLSASDAVIIDPSDSIAEGQQVNIAKSSAVSK
jgi:RND family efflux transporter MFP subunit